MGKVRSQFGKRRRRAVLFFVAMLAGLLLLAVVPAFSQSCALCYTQAASSGQKMIQALKSGILVLIIPPTLGSIAMLFVLHQKRNQVRRTGLHEDDHSAQDW